MLPTHPMHFLSIIALECCFLLYKVNQLYVYIYSPPSNTLVLTLSNKYEKETLICFMSIFWSDTKTLSRLFASKCTFVCFNFICKNLCVKASHLSVSISSVAQSCLTLFDCMDCSRSGFPCPSPTPGAYSNSCPSSR